MSTVLRLKQSSVGEDKYRAELALEGDGPRHEAEAAFDFKLTAQDQEDIRWYLENFLQYPLDPGPQIADRVEKRMDEIGKDLFKKVFQANDETRDLWATIRPGLNDLRVEVVTEVQEAASIPWELMRDHRMDTALALRARAFVRTHPRVVVRPYLPQAESGPVRILLVICRPREGEDVPFRSVAGRLLKGLDDEARKTLQLDVLRPPTFEQLGRALRQAEGDGRPYHIVHFDGHGTYIDAPEKSKLAELVSELSVLMLSGVRPGKHGYLLFENPKIEENAELIDGATLGQLMAETKVPVLLLNACRSAYAEPPSNPDSVAEEKDVQTQVRAFGTLAQEVIDAGVAGVVAMQYNVYAVTAAQFVVDLYAALAQGRALGEAVTLGRKQLNDQPMREIAFTPRRLEDWVVPVVYEAAPIRLFPERTETQTLNITLAAEKAMTERGTLVGVPEPPDVGFFGRDETILALDRAFDTQSVVLLHAYAGSGKTTAAAEFARWYATTGGVDGPVLFTSFEQHKPLARVLDEIGRVFGPTLEQSGIQWLALPQEARREVAVQVLQQIPVLWIWDNVEPVAGFPAGADSAWSADEQAELVDFLREAGRTKAKFLLTSRREERAWLGDLPRRIHVPRMPLQERVQLARGVAEKYGHRITDVDDWRPLLRFTEGNPLTITVLVGEALRQGLKTEHQIEDFVARLRAGEEAFEDEKSEGRDKSLGASLSYGFEQAFSEGERAQLALLHFFQGFVDVDALRQMGSLEKTTGEDHALPEVRGLTRETGIALLDRAAEIGLLTAFGGGFYSIHPALPWYFRGLFEGHYPGEAGVRAARAFVAVMGELGNYYHKQYGAGNRDVIGILGAEEANLLHARRLARGHGWGDPVTSAMQGLRQLYGHTGRRAEWQRLVEEIVPDFVDLTTDGPLPGRDMDSWRLVNDYRVHLAREARDWAEAERLQRTHVELNRQRAAPILAASSEILDSGQRSEIRFLAVSLHELGQIQREQGKADCVVVYEEAADLLRRIGDQSAEAISAFNLGKVYTGVSIPAIRDLDQAERWYRRSLEMFDEGDRQGQAKCLSQLGLVARERFKEARAAQEPEEMLLGHINAAARFYHQALEFDPPDALDDLAVDHNQLGNVYFDAGDLDRAEQHWRDAIRYKEAAGDLYAAGQIRFNVSVGLVNAGRLGDALLYAQEAERNFESYGAGAAADIQDAQGLIAAIEQAMQGGE